MTGKLLDRLEWVLQGLAGLFLAIVFVLVTAQVLGRFVFDISLATASELSIYAMIWSIFLGAAVAFRGNRHIAMTWLRDRAPETTARHVSLFVLMCLFLFLTIVVFKGQELSLRAMRQLSPAAGLPVGYVVMSLPIGSALALVFVAEEFFKQLKGK